MSQDHVSQSMPSVIPKTNIGPLLMGDQAGGTIQEKPKKRRGRRATSLVRLYYLLRESPLLSNKVISEKLGISQNAVRQARFRLKEYNKITKLPFLYCPSCLVRSLTPCEEGHVCSQCGAVFPRESIKVNPYGRSPVNALHWGSGLGSAIDCHDLKFGVDCFGSKIKPVIISLPQIIESQVKNKIEDSFVMGCLEEFMFNVRTLNLDLSVTDSLGKLLRNKIQSFRTAYPLIPLDTKVKQQIILSTLAEASLDLPRLEESYQNYLNKIERDKKFDFLIRGCRSEVLRLLKPFDFPKDLTNAVSKLIKNLIEEQFDSSKDQLQLKHKIILKALERIKNDFPRVSKAIVDYKAIHGLVGEPVQ